MGTTDLIKLDGMSLEALGEMANMAAEAVAKATRSAVDHAIRAGRALEAAKEQVEHGEWSEWLAKNFDYSQEHARRFMTISSNSTRVWNLKEATSIRAALRMIADENEADSKSAKLAHLKTGQVKVVESSDDEATEAEPEHEADTPSVDPPTNRKTSKESRKVSESKKPKTAAITPEIVEPEEDIPTVVRVDDRDGLLEACCRVVPPTAILRYLINICPAESSAKLAKQLRDAADIVNPPTKFRAPDVDEVAAFCQERQNKVDPESFVAHYRANGWKLSNGNKMQDWKSAVITWEKREKTNGRGNRNSAALTGADW